MALVDKLTQLEGMSALRNPFEVERFNAILGEIAELGDPASIGPLLLLLRDGHPEEEVQFGIVHVVEDFTAHQEARELLRVLPQLSRQAPEWTDTLHWRILNDPSSREAYAAELRAASELSRRAARTVLERIRHNDPDEFAAHCNELLRAA